MRHGVLTNLLAGLLTALGVSSAHAQWQANRARNNSFFIDIS